MQTYESSTATLRAILAHPMLQKEKIEETMDAMAEANAEAREIESEINIGLDAAQGEGTADDADIEEELNELIAKSEREADAAREKIAEEKRVKLSAEELIIPSYTPISPLARDPESIKIGEAA